MLADSRSSHKHAQRALYINELLARVFSFNDSSANACCACVCRRWAEPALDILWRVVGVTVDEDEDGIPGLYELFELLSPLKEVGVEGSEDEYWTVVENISSKSWNRFKYYANRVRILQTDKSDRMHKSLYRTIGSLKPMPYLFPNLQKFILNLQECGRGEGPDSHYIQYSVQFLHPTLEHLDVRFPVADKDEDNAEFDEWHKRVHDFFDEVIMRSPNISRLALCFSDRVATVEKELLRFLTVLPSLQELDLPPLALTPTVLAALARLPSLRRIGNGNRYENETPSQDDLCVPYVLPLHADFPNLRELTIAGRLVDLRIAFADDSSRFAKIENLKISMLKANPASHVQAALSAIAQACPNLRDLILTRDDDPGDKFLDQERDEINAACLGPVTLMSRLESFTLVYNHPVAIGDGELVDFVMKCPALKELYLTMEPLDIDAVPALTLNVLGKLALKDCPIKELGLYVNANSPLDKDSLPSGRLLKNLTFIDFGISPIDDSVERINSVAGYLSKFLPFGWDSDFGLRVYNGSEIDIDFSSLREPWRKVYRLLDVAETAVMDDMKWVKEVEQRNKELEARLRKYEDTMSTSVDKSW